MGQVRSADFSVSMTPCGMIVRGCIGVLSRNLREILERLTMFF